MTEEKRRFSRIIFKMQAELTVEGKLFKLIFSFAGLEIVVKDIDVTVTFRNITKNGVIYYGCDGVLAPL